MSIGTLSAQLRLLKITVLDVRLSFALGDVVNHGVASDTLDGPGLLGCAEWLPRRGDGCNAAATFRDL